jgi:hypothetical protein
VVLILIFFFQFEIFSSIFLAARFVVFSTLYVLGKDVSGVRVCGIERVSDTMQELEVI